MEKNIASHDLSDMMVYEGMYAQGRRFYFRQKFVYLQKIAASIVGMFEHVGKMVRSAMSTSPRSIYSKQVHFSSTANAISAISLASILISFFWLTLYFSATV